MMGRGLEKICAEIYTEVVPERTRWLRAIRALAGTTPSSVAYFSSSCLRRRIQEATRKISFNVVLVHCAFAAQYGLDVPAKFRVIDFGDLDSGKSLGPFQWRSFPLSWGYYLEAKKLRRYERQIADAFDYCTLTTQGELEEFKKLNVGPFTQSYSQWRGRQLFPPEWRARSGQTRHCPCRSYGLFSQYRRRPIFAKSIFPVVRQSVPDAQLHLVGSSPTRAVRSHSHTGRHSNGPRG